MSVPISARKEGTYFIHSIAPDVCLTPMGSAMVPVGYNTISFLDTAVRTSRTVRNNDLKDFQVNTRTSMVLGHEPGTGKGVIVKGYRSHAVVKRGAPTVFSEGWAVVRHGDPAKINRHGPGRVETPRSHETHGEEYY
ncbi:PAAR-like domain-containing protein [Rhizobium panacihumi]|uniref:PAAR-like domain-containing protein n=1 Tax=Rhizobium panacihumi TaxID=2008450 RepID=UPI003D7A9F38